ncbi:MAG TPA: hypothetical protein VKL99_11470 [Candidatus Angelobacter sp.]|nr:hypothetical protein [Candidatus Angelobacter sp.]
MLEVATIWPQPAISNNEIKPTETRNSWKKEADRADFMWGPWHTNFSAAGFDAASKVAGLPLLDWLKSRSAAPLQSVTSSAISSIFAIPPCGNPRHRFPAFPCRLSRLLGPLTLDFGAKSFHVGL